MRRTGPAAIAPLIALLAGCPVNESQLPPAAAPDDAAVDSRAAAVAAAAAPSPTPPPGDPGGVELTVDMATPYFAGAAGPAGSAAARFALEDWRGARAGFARALAGEKDPTTRARLRLVIAHCDAELGDWKPAADGYEAALAGLPQLEDYLAYQIARARYFLGQLDQAERRAREVDPASISGAEAELLIGDILRGRRDPAAVAAHYAAYVAARPKGMRLGEARFYQAEAAETLGKPDEAVALYRAIAAAAPLSRWAERAQDRVAALAGSRPGAAKPATADELITRGMAYFDAMRNEQSEKAFADALAAPGITPASRCVARYHQAQSVFKQRNRTRAAPLFDAAFAACEAAGDADLIVKAAYQAGRCYANIGQYDTARARYAVAEQKGPQSTYADDARLRQAEAADELGDDAAVTELLSTIPTRYPGGDMKAEALWRLAWRAFKAGDDKGAIGWLDKQIAVAPIDDNYWAEGQAQYWRGRAHLRRGDRAAALAAWEETVRLYPMGYYALLALNRLREVAPDRFAAATAAIAATPPGDPGTLAFAPRALYGTPGFARALELLRLGLGGPAAAELRQLGLSPPGDRKRVDDPDRIDAIWAMAFLYHKAGRFSDSHWVTRWNVLDFKRAWPVGANRTRWEIAYPPGWRELVTTHAAKNGYPPDILMAHVREESAFNPLLESFANAIGLTQMIIPTAKRFAGGVRVDREALRDPDTNVTIGARFLGFLWTKYGGRVAFTVPSYNAGEGATQKWLRQRGNWATDEWAEEIPYDETRNYSKRVLGSYFAYAYLRDGSVPEMPNAIPPSLIPGGAAENVDARGRKRLK